MTLAIAAGTLSSPLFAYVAPDAVDPRQYQPAPPGMGIYLGRLILSPWVSISETYDDDAFSVQKGFCGRRRRQDLNGDGVFDSLSCAETLAPQGASLTTARAQVALRLPYSHSYTSLIWNGQYRDYSSYATPIKASQLLVFENRMNFSNGTMFVVRDESVWGFQEVQRLETKGFVGDRELESPGTLTFSATRFVRHHPEAIFDAHVLGNWGVVARAERTSMSFDAAQFSNASGAVGGENDQRGGVFDYYDYVIDTFEGRIYRDFNVIRVYGAALRGRSVQDRSKFNDSQQADCRARREDVPDTNGDGTLDDRCVREIDSEHISQGEVDLGVTGRILPSTFGDIKAGYVSWSFRNETSKPFRGLGVTARVEHVFTRRTKASLDLSRSALQATGQVSGYYVRSDATLGFERTLTAKMYLRSALTVRRYQHHGPERSGAQFEFTDYYGDIQLKYRPGSSEKAGPFLLTAAYSPVKRKSAISDIEYSSHRISLSALYGWF